MKDIVLEALLGRKNSHKSLKIEMERLELDELIMRCASGSREALEEIYRRKSRGVYAVAMRILRDPEEAKDVLQDAFVKIWTKAPQFDHSGAKADAWINMISRNAAIDRIRRAKSKIVTEEYEDIHATSRSASNEDRMSLSRCLEATDPQKREIVLQVYVGGAHYEDIVSQYDLPMNTVKTWLRRTLLALKRCMETGGAP